LIVQQSIRPRVDEKANGHAKLFVTLQIYGTATLNYQISANSISTTTTTTVFSGFLFWLWFLLWCFARQVAFQRIKVTEALIISSLLDKFQRTFSGAIEMFTKGHWSACQPSAATM